MQNVPIYVDVVEEFRRLAKANIPMYPVSSEVNLYSYGGHRKAADWVPPAMPPAVNIREEHWVAVYKTDTDIDSHSVRDRVRRYAPWLASVMDAGAFFCKQGAYKLWHTPKFEAVRVVRPDWHASYQANAPLSAPDTVVAYIHPPGHYGGEAPVYRHSVRLHGMELYGNTQKTCTACGKSVTKYLCTQHPSLCLPCARKMLLDLRDIIDQFDSEVP